MGKADGVARCVLGQKKRSAREPVDDEDKQFGERPAGEVQKGGLARRI